MVRKVGPATPENQLTVNISYSPLKVVFNYLLKWTPSVNTQEVFIHKIRLQQCGWCPVVRMLVSTPQAEPYEMTVDSETEPFNNLYNTLYDYNRSLKYDSQFKRELERLVEYLEDEL